MMGGGMGMPQVSPRRDPMLETRALQDLMGSMPAPGPVYPRWFDIPRKPDPMVIANRAQLRFNEYSEWRLSLRHDLKMLRMADAGIFRNDEPDIKAKIMETYQSHGLVDEFNLAVSWLSGLQRRVVKEHGSEETKAAARKVKLAAEWLLRYESQCHTEKGEIPTNVLEPKILLAYGLVAKRRVLDRFSEPYESPFITRYIDPAQLVPEFDDRGIKCLYRVYSAKVRDLADTYGDFAPSLRKRLENQYGKFDDDLDLTNVVEYWDRWWRCVTVAGENILPVTEHKYGEVPYTIGYGPLGEPLNTTLPDDTGATAVTAENYRENLPYKSVSFVRFRKVSHIYHEALMTRVLHGVQLELFPPYIRMRSLAASGTGPAPDLDGSPGAPNEGILGEEEFADYPFPRNSGQNRQALMDALSRDMMTGSAPLSAYGHMDQSNISGTANKQAAQAGLHLWKPWVQSLESFNARDLSKALRIWQRLGSVVEYGGPERRPFTVPVQKPYRGEESSFELSRDLIKKVGAEVRITMASVNPEEWLLRAQTMEQLNKQGFSIEYLSNQLLGVDYDPQMFEEWQEERAIKLAMEHPKFLEINVIPAMLLSELAEAEGDEMQQQVLAQMAQRWDELVVQPAMMKHQMEMQQYAAQPTADEAVPVGGEGPQQGSGGGMPRSMQGVALPEMGRGPGSVTGRQGGPQGPVGPRRQGP